ncbi:lycopene elongase [Halalkalicoccus paucihalophilus]|uniref:Lycopene elongase n=1 Tax=Halalkalicoccus paucihalophilus TaxID=1008153 RepID=A0A151AF64_9EURY|nr:prenyltransferase [Halalkalicoccus paucihalophilus]KYH26326.1 lycopene elongase [Halalkalicoccus paucihalophilus]
MTLRYLLALSRPRFWFYLAGPVLVGAVFGAERVNELLSVPLLALFLYFLLPANVFLYGINDVYDREIDAKNPKKEGREARFEGQRVVPIAVVVCALVPLAFFSLFPPGTWVWLAVFLLLGAAYSAPPARFKTTPLLDSISNGLYLAPGAAAYVALAGSQPPLLAIAGGWLWTMGMHTFSAIPDIGPDRAAGIETTATLLGESWTYAYCGACWTLSALCFGALDGRLGALFLVYPTLVLAVSLTEIDVSRAYWWFPVINVVVGALFTMGGLWLLVYR